MLIESALMAFGVASLDVAIKMGSELIALSAPRDRLGEKK